MAYAAEIIADSIDAANHRLTTFEVTMPRIVLSEFNTHRMLSRNSASSRAIPVERQITRVLDDPFIPVQWGVNQSGMQANAELPAEEVPLAEAEWLNARDRAVLGAIVLIGGIDQLKDPALQTRIEQLQKAHHDKRQGLPTPLHKQIANRLLEPFMWHTIIATATDWSNFFGLRANPMAQPEIQRAAYMMLDAYQTHRPELLRNDQWHLPLIQPDESSLPIEDLKKMAVGRCARVSYLTHDTGKREPAKDIQLHDTLRQSGHMSPFEHVARPMTAPELDEAAYSGNFHGWHQYRKEMAGENDFSLHS